MTKGRQLPPATVDDSWGVKIVYPVPLDLNASFDACNAAIRLYWPPLRKPSSVPSQTSFPDVEFTCRSRSNAQETKAKREVSEDKFELSVVAPVMTYDFSVDQMVVKLIPATIPRFEDKHTPKLAVWVGGAPRVGKVRPIIVIQSYMRW